MQLAGMLLLDLTVKEQILDSLCFEDPHPTCCGGIWNHSSIGIVHMILLFSNIRYILCIPRLTARNHLQNTFRGMNVNMQTSWICWGVQRTPYTVEFWCPCSRWNQEKFITFNSDPLLVHSQISNEELSYEDVVHHLCNLLSSQFREELVHWMVLAPVWKLERPWLRSRSAGCRSDVQNLWGVHFLGFRRLDSKMRCFYWHRAGHKKLSACWKRKLSKRRRAKAPGIPKSERKSTQCFYFFRTSFF